MAAYLDFFNETPTVARSIANKYKQYPVDKWRRKFDEITQELNEAEGYSAKVVDEEARDSTQNKLTSTEPSLEFSVESKKITLHYQNLSQCSVSYYGMDIELMFSTNPFVSQKLGQFSWIKPNREDKVSLPSNQNTLILDLPSEFHHSNVIVCVQAGGIMKSHPYYSQSLLVSMIENYGQLKVQLKESNKPLQKVYVKVYAKNKNTGAVSFYKDGYTDIRGRFDYTSLSTNDLDYVEKFSILISSEQAGAVIREAQPPKV
jgi:hypothetical protein